MVISFYLRVLWNVIGKGRLSPVFLSVSPSNRKDLKSQPVWIVSPLIHVFTLIPFHHPMIPGSPICQLESLASLSGSITFPLVRRQAVFPSGSVSEWFHRIYYDTRIKPASDGADGACEAKHGAALQLLLFLNDFPPAASSMLLLLKRGRFRSLADILWGGKAGWSLIRSSEITGRPSACLEQRFQSATYTSCLGVHHVRAQLLWINHLSDSISPPLWCYCTLGLGSLPFFLSGVAA